MTRLRGLPAGPERPFVCPWCAARFIVRRGEESLEEHWRLSQECSRNRGVSNQTQSKYNVRDAEVPGLALSDREDRDA
jgi:hypothetical protein